ncbi:MAG: hypothetical protein LM590_06120 [Thermofilum sp.]|nr:hypothetical protein [Thermofilum sp.]
MARVDVALHVVNLVLGVSTWVFFGKSFEAANPVYQQYGGDFVSFFILGLMLNSFYTYTLDAFRMATLFILRGRVGQHLSMYDYIKLSGIPFSAPLLAFVVNGYIEQFISIFIYFCVGLLFGLKIGGGNYPIALLGIFIGWVAVASIGLISASMITVIGAWKGIEPVRWLVGVLTGLVSGVYFPFEVLPEQLQMISRVLPQTYAMRIARLALLQGFGLSELWADLTVLTLIALILLP